MEGLQWNVRQSGQAHQVLRRQRIQRSAFSLICTAENLCILSNKCILSNLCIGILWNLMYRSTLESYVYSQIYVFSLIYVILWNNSCILSNLCILSFLLSSISGA